MKKNTEQKIAYLQAQIRVNAHSITEQVETLNFLAEEKIALEKALANITELEGK